MKYLVISMLMLSTFSWGAKKDLPIVTMEKAALESIEQKLYYPVQIKSRVDSKVLADNEYIVIKRLVTLGQKVKKGTPLLELRRQDTSVHFENRILRSPVKGVVASIPTQVGQYVVRSKELIHINDPKKLYGQIEVSAADYNKIQTNLVGKVNLNSLNLKDIPVKVKAIGSAVDQVTGTVAVELEFTNKKELLIPGVLGQAELTLNQEQKILVPEKALYYIGEEVFIPVLDKDKAVKKIPVKLGKRYKERIEVLEGLDVGTDYIKQAAKYLTNGSQVKVNQPKQKK